MHSVISRMFGEKLPFDVADAVFVAPIWYRGDNTDVLALYNFSIDFQTFPLMLNGTANPITIPPMTIHIMELKR